MYFLEKKKLAIKHEELEIVFLNGCQTKPYVKKIKLYKIN